MSDTAENSAFIDTAADLFRGWTVQGCRVHSERDIRWFWEVEMPRALADGVDEDGRVLHRAWPEQRQPVCRTHAANLGKLWAKHRAVLFTATEQAIIEYRLRAAGPAGEALLRQALEALEQIATDLPWELTGLQADTIAALRERLGEGEPR